MGGGDCFAAMAFAGSFDGARRSGAFAVALIFIFGGGSAVVIVDTTALDGIRDGARRSGAAPLEVTGFIRGGAAAFTAAATAFGGSFDGARRIGTFSTETCIIGGSALLLTAGTATV